MATEYGRPGFAGLLQLYVNLLSVRRPTRSASRFAAGPSPMDVTPPPSPAPRNGAAQPPLVLVSEGVAEVGGSDSHAAAGLASHRRCVAQRSGFDA